MQATKENLMQGEIKKNIYTININDFRFILLDYTYKIDLFYYYDEYNDCGSLRWIFLCNFSSSTIDIFCYLKFENLI